MTPSNQESKKPRPTGVPPPKRDYPKRRGGLRDVDAQARLTGIMPAVVMGGAGLMWGAVLPINPLLFAAILAAFGYFVVPAIVSLGSKLMIQIFIQPSGESTPPPRAYSVAESLAVRGEYEEAIEKYVEMRDELPTDSEPYLRIARLYRDKLNSPDDALDWLKRARNEAKFDVGRDIFITQEVVELYTHKLSTPLKAIPELARLADRFPDSPAAQTAKDQIKRLRDAHAPDSP